MGQSLAKVSFVDKSPEPIRMRADKLGVGTAFIPVCTDPTYTNVYLVTSSENGVVKAININGGGYPFEVCSESEYLPVTIDSIKIKRHWGT